jgi:hypothetical protein
MQRDGKRDADRFDAGNSDDVGAANPLHVGRALIAAKRFEEAIAVLSAALEDEFPVLRADRP